MSFFTGQFDKLLQLFERVRLIEREVVGQDHDLSPAVQLRELRLHLPVEFLGGLGQLPAVLPLHVPAEDLRLPLLGQVVGQPSGVLPGVVPARAVQTILAAKGREKRERVSC